MKDFKKDTDEAFSKYYENIDFREELDFSKEIRPTFEAAAIWAREHTLIEVGARLERQDRKIRTLTQKVGDAVRTEVLDHLLDLCRRKYERLRNEETSEFGDGCAGAYAELISELKYIKSQLQPKKSKA